MMATSSATAKDEAQAPFTPTFARLGRSVWLTLEASYRADASRASEFETRLAKVGDQVQQVTDQGLAWMAIGDWSDRQAWSDAQWRSFLRLWPQHSTVPFDETSRTEDEEELLALFNLYWAYYTSLPGRPEGAPVKEGYATIQQVGARVDRELVGFADRLGSPPPRAPVASNRRHVWTIYLLVVCYALGYQLQRPIEPFFVDSLVGTDDGAVTYGRVSAAFGAAQGLGSLVIGHVLDRRGVRAGLLLNFLACALYYGLMSLAGGGPDAVFGGRHGLAILYLSKVPGAAVAGFLCAQTAVVRLTAAGGERVAALGRLTTAYTVGGVVGPYLGGVLGANGDYFLGARLAAGLSLVAAAVVLALPAGIDGAAAEDPDAAPGKEEEEAPREAWSARAARVLRLAGPLLAVKVCTRTASSMARSAQPVVLKSAFGFDERALGTVMSAQFATGGLANAFLLAPVTRVLGGRGGGRLVPTCVAVMGATYLLQAGLFGPAQRSLPEAARGPLYVGLALVLSVFQYALGTSITAETSRRVPRATQGTLLGLEHALFAAAGVVGPLAGTSLYAAGGIGGLALACGAVFFAVLAAWLAWQGVGSGKEKVH